MSILIPGKMPKDGECIVITSDGFARKYLTGEVMIYYDATPDKVSTAAELPPHGRLIDADANIKVLNACIEKPENDIACECYKYAKALLNACPTIIPPDPEGGADG